MEPIKKNKEQRYREKLRQDPVRWAAHKEKERIRKRRYQELKKIQKLLANTEPTPVQKNQDPLSLARKLEKKRENERKKQEDPVRYEEKRKLRNEKRKQKRLAKKRELELQKKSPMKKVELSEQNNVLDLKNVTPETIKAKAKPIKEKKKQQTRETLQSPARKKKHDDSVLSTDYNVNYCSDEDNGLRERGRYQKKPLILGFHEDCEVILAKFKEQEVLNLRSFAKIWKEMNLCFLFTGRDNEKELCEATYEMFSVVISFITNKKCEKDSDTRIAAFYLLYFLYYKQPFPKMRVKIRITIEQWNNVKEFCLFCVQFDIREMMAMFLKLIYDNAFHITITKRMMGPETSECRQFDKTNSNETNDWPNDMKTIWESKVLQEIKNKYLDVQNSVKKLEMDNLTSKTFMPSVYIDDLIKMSEALSKGDMQTYKQIRTTIQKNKVGIGARRKALKQKQVSSKCAVGMDKLKLTSKTFQNAEMDNEDNDDDIVISSDDDDDDIGNSNFEQHLNSLGLSFEKAEVPIRKPIRKSVRRRTLIKHNINTEDPDDPDYVMNIDSDDSTKDVEFRPSISKPKNIFNTSPLKKIRMKKKTKRTSWKKSIILGPNHKQKAKKGRKMKHYYEGE